MSRIYIVKYEDRDHYWIETTHTQMCVRLILTDCETGQLIEVIDMSKVKVKKCSLNDIDRIWANGQ